MRLLSIIFLAAAFLVCELSAWRLFHPANRNIPHDLKNNTQRNNLYNQRVVQIALVERPFFTHGLARLLPVMHSGVRVTLEDGRQFLIHKGKNFGDSSETVVVDASHITNNYTVKYAKPVQGKTVGDFVKAGGKSYNVFLDNCNQAAKRMMKE